MDAATKLFVTYMKYNHEVEVNLDDLFFEGTTLYHDEIDLNIFPVKYLDKLPNPALFLTAVFDDMYAQNYIFTIVADTDNRKWLHAACARNFEIVDAYIPLDID